MTAIAVTIAGSDSGGGAGIQADLKAFSALGAYGATVVTALTAQNTLGVRAISAAEPEFIRAQIDAVYSDLAVTATKIGMLANVEVIRAVAAGLRAHQAKNIVLDPVMVATSGDKLLDADAEHEIVASLFPLADLITPNLHESARLLGQELAQTKLEMEAQAQGLRDLGARGVLLKGGHGSGAEAVDLLLIDDEQHWLSAPRIATKNTHGTGCTLSSAITAGLANGQPLAQATDAAKQYLSAAIAAADQLQIGEGHGPVHHFHQWW